MAEPNRNIGGKDDSDLQGRLRPDTSQGDDAYLGDILSSDASINAGAAGIDGGLDYVKNARELGLDLPEIPRSVELAGRSVSGASNVYSLGREALEGDVSGVATETSVVGCTAAGVAGATKAGLAVSTTHPVVGGVFAVGVYKFSIYPTPGSPATRLRPPPRRPIAPPSV